MAPSASMGGCLGSSGARSSGDAAMSDSDYVPIWLRTPSLVETRAKGHEGPITKGKSRLEQAVAAKPLVKVTDAQFKKIVRERDRMRCRRCGRKVIVTMDRDPLRCEVHHVHGRVGVLRHEDRCALVLCCACHEKVTGKVNEKLIIVATKTLVIDGRTLTDARAKVTFERVA